MTKIWVTRHYVLHNHAMYVFDKKTDHNPRRKYHPSPFDKVIFALILISFFIIDVVYLRGLYFKKIFDKTDKFGLLLYSEGDRFKARRMYHRDENVLETWMRYLSKHCGFYSPAEIYE